MGETPKSNVLITGATSGIGLATVRAIAGLHGDSHSLTLACRNVEKAREVIASIETECPNVQIELLQVDFGSLQSVARVITEIHSRQLHFDVVILNAGVLLPGRSKTPEDALDTTLQVNFLAQYALIQGIIEHQTSNENRSNNTVKNSPLKVITLTSRMHRFCGPVFRVPRDSIEWMGLFRGTKKSSWKAYALSKLAMAQLAVALNRNFPEIVQAIALDPGAVHTPMTDHLGSNSENCRICGFRQKLRSFIQRHCLQTPEDAARNVLACFIDEEGEFEQLKPNEYRCVDKTKKFSKRVLNLNCTDSLLLASDLVLKKWNL